MNRLGILHHWLRTASVPRDTLLTIVGILAGWGISHWYYVKSLHDARTYAAEHARVEQMLLRGIESVGIIHYTRDSTGRINGVDIQLAGTAPSGASASGHL